MHKTARSLYASRKSHFTKILTEKNFLRNSRFLMHIGYQDPEWLGKMNRTSFTGRGFTFYFLLIFGGFLTVIYLFTHLIKVLPFDASKFLLMLFFPNGALFSNDLNIYGYSKQKYFLTLRLQNVFQSTFIACPIKLK